MSRSVQVQEVRRASIAEKVALKTGVIYEDGKLVLIDDEAVEELMRERGA